MGFDEVTVSVPLSCPLRLAVIDDSPADVRLISVILERYMPETEVVSAIGSERGWQLVRGEGVYQGTQLSLVMIDLRIDGQDGLELVRHVRQNPAMSHVPIIVLSASLDPKDVDRSYAAGANAFVPKGASYEDQERILGTLAEFWCSAAALPSMRSPGAKD